LSLSVREQSCSLNAVVVKDLSDLTGYNLSLQPLTCSRTAIVPALLKAHLQGQHSLLDLPADHFDACVQHYTRCKKLDPHNTSACFLVLASRGPWSKYRHLFPVLLKIPKGTPLYVDPRDQALIPAIQNMLVLCDKPLPLLHLHAFADDTQPLHMTFPSSLAGQKVHVLVDTGASHSFMDASFAHQHGFHIHTDSGNVNCGGNAIAHIIGSSTVMMTFQNSFRQRVKFYITDLPKGHPVILGNTWLIDNKVVLDHASRTMQAVVGQNLSLPLPGAQSFYCGGGPTPYNPSLS
jgi:hypothetical protein